MEGGSLFRCVGETAEDLLRFIREHGQGRGAERRAGGSIEAFGRSLRTIREVQSKFISALIYPAVVALWWDRDHYFLHDLHVAKVHDDLRGAQSSLASATQILMGISKFLGILEIG